LDCGTLKLRARFAFGNDLATLLIYCGGIVGITRSQHNDVLGYRALLLFRFFASTFNAHRFLLGKPQNRPGA
jgi:hypothetical protein